MKKFAVIAMTLGLVSACEEKPKNPVAVYGNTMIQSYQKGKQAEEIGNLAAIKDAIRIYHAQHEKYPQRLDELKPIMGADIDFSTYEYNPENGDIAVKSR